MTPCSSGASRSVARTCVIWRRTSRANTGGLSGSGRQELPRKVLLGGPSDQGAPLCLPIRLDRSHQPQGRLQGELHRQTSCCAQTRRMSRASGFGVGANVEADLRRDYFHLSHQKPQKIIVRDPLRIGAIEIASAVSIGRTSAWVRVSGLVSRGVRANPLRETTRRSSQQCVRRCAFAFLMPQR
jgi:hypothetical protein